MSRGFFSQSIIETFFAGLEPLFLAILGLVLFIIAFFVFLVVPEIVSEWWERNEKILNKIKDAVIFIGLILLAIVLLGYIELMKP